MLKASQMVEWVKSKVGCGYVYGVVDQIVTIAILKEKDAQYGKLPIIPANYYQKGGDYTKGMCARWIGKLSFDCSGLIKSGRKELSGVYLDVSAQGLYDQCLKRGKINTMPLVPGCGVFMYIPSEGRIGHVGMYVGGGKVVEARGALSGVVLTNLADRAWGYWGQFNWLDYDLPDEKGKAVPGKEADAGDATIAKKDDPEFAEAIGTLAKKYSISADYWKAKADIDPWFPALMIKLANACAQA